MAVTVTTAYATPAVAASLTGSGGATPWAFPASAKVIDGGYAFSIFGAGASVHELHIARLIKNGVIGGTNIATNQQITTGSTLALGGTSNLWGNTLTADDVNDPTFGFAMALGIWNGTTNTIGSEYLTIQNLGFALPAGATVLGIEVLLTYVLYAGGGGTTGLGIDGVQVRVTYSWNPQVRAIGQAGGAVYSPQQVTTTKDKTFTYDIFDKAHQFVGRWKDVATEPHIKKQINTGIVTLEVELARNELSLAVASDNLALENDELLTTELDEALLIDLTASTGLGAGTDADLNYEAEVRAYWGDFGELLTEAGEPILTEADEFIMVEQGAPNGRMIYQGYLDEFELDYGNNDDIAISMTSHSDELANIMLESYDSIYENVSGSAFGTYGIDGGGPTDTHILYQRFTAASAHNLRRVGLSLFQGWVGTGVQATVQLWSGTPTSPTTLLASATLELAPYLAQEYIFDFGIDIALANGSSYFYQLTSNSAKTGGNVTYPINWQYASSGSDAWYMYGAGTMVNPANTGFLFKNYYGGGATTVTYNSMSPSAMLKLAIDFARSRGSRMTYSNSTIEATGTVVSLTVKNNTVLDFMDAVLKACPTDWYWWIDPATNEVHLHARPTTPKRFYTLKKDINRFKIKRSLKPVVNDVYFNGGGTPTAIYVRRTDQLAISQWRRKLEKMSDIRVTDVVTAAIFAQNEINRKKVPPYTATASVLAVRDEPIEDVQIGELVAFGAFGDFVDTIQLQLGTIDYYSDYLDVAFGTLPPRVPKRIEDIRRNLDELEAANLPSAPS
jgi:hypothetical protein